MGFITETPNVAKERAIRCRSVVAILLTMGILLVVLLTCLLILEKPSTTSQPSTGPLANTTTSSTIQSTTGPLDTPTTTSTSAGLPGETCPSKRQGLVPVPAGYADLNLTDGKQYIVDRNITVNSIRISDGASLTVLDNGTSISIVTYYIIIGNNGALQIGSDNCPHRSDLEILLKGRSDDPGEDPTFGHKFIGVEAGGSIDIHGPWKLAWTYLNTTIEPSMTNFMVSLVDSHKMSWKPGDIVVVATSDYDMDHAEEFELMQCDNCLDNQILIKGPAKYRHVAETLPGDVFLSAEVGILTRNIKIHGEMEPQCYGQNLCQFFNFDTYGGHVQVLFGAKIARFEGIELFNMGQQQLGRYPIHFHRAMDAYGNYSKQLSIHHCFSRCVTIHSTYGILVEDVVGYDTLGHCFFLEDGDEMNNRLNHNLGLSTKPGTLLPSDRDTQMCLNLTASINGYVPDTPEECESISTFWIPHPANYLTNNSAAGSLGYGYFFLFHRESSGPSAGILPPFHGERSPLGSFVGNRAHANTLFGFFIDRGVKIDTPSAVDPRDFLALIDLERYEPHDDRNLSLPRAPAIILEFTGYMNNVGMFVRGGDVWIHNAKLSDNDVAVQMSSDPSLPYDQGSHQEVVNSVIIGRSPMNDDWSSVEVPCVGVEIRDGPILVENNTFYSFPADDSRKSYAIGFYPQNSGQNSPANTVKFNEFIDVDTVLFFGQVGGLLGSYFGDYNMDGDLTQIVRIIENNGSRSEWLEGYAVRLDYPLLSNDSSCVPNDTFKLCAQGSFGQLYVNVSSKSLKLGIEDITSRSKQLILEGVDRDNKERPTSIQFQPILTANHTYRINWLNGTAPNSLNLSMLNFAENDFVQLEICYPPGTSFFSVGIYILDQITDSASQISSIMMSSNRSAMDQTWQEAQYFWNETSSLLYVKLQTTWAADGYSYCAVDGCHFVNILANVTYTGFYQCN